jgi:hypothetical protein
VDSTPNMRRSFPVWYTRCCGCAGCPRTHASRLAALRLGQFRGPHCGNHHATPPHVAACPQQPPSTPVDGMPRRWTPAARPVDPWASAVDGSVDNLPPKNTLQEAENVRCPYCAADHDRVVDSRTAEGGTAVRRRRPRGGRGAPPRPPHPAPPPPPAPRRGRRGVGPHRSIVDTRAAAVYLLVSTLSG